MQFVALKIAANKLTKLVKLYRRGLPKKETFKYILKTSYGVNVV